MGYLNEHCLDDDISTEAPSSRFPSPVRARHLDFDGCVHRDLPMRDGDSTPPGTPRHVLGSRMRDADNTPPSTPRQVRLVPSLDTPPGTPRQVRLVPSLGTPPPAPRAQPMPFLMRALRSNSFEQVQAAILAEPHVAQFPFWDHDLEPPLCFAVRHKCTAAIIELLLLNGADVEARDTRGRTHLDILKLVRQDAFVSYEYIHSIEQVFNVSTEEEVATGSSNDAFAAWDFTANEWCPLTSFFDQAHPRISSAWAGA